MKNCVYNRQLLFLSYSYVLGMHVFKEVMLIMYFFPSIHFILTF